VTERGRVGEGSGGPTGLSRKRHEFVFQVGLLVVVGAQVLECGPRHARLQGKLPMGRVTVVEVVEGLRGLGACPAKRLWLGNDLRC